jgi:hypothetical protein
LFRRPFPCFDSRRRRKAAALERHIDDARQLVVVLRLCVAGDMELVFG